MTFFAEIIKAIGLKKNESIQRSELDVHQRVRQRQKNISLALQNDEFPVVLIVGRAGTGKSTLIRDIAKSGLNQVILAPTGVAALNVGGQTIHSFFQLPHRIIDPKDIHAIPTKSHIYQNLERLIIDEMSMVRPDLLDTIDLSLRINRDSKEPFGGVQLIAVGDFLQIPPVVKKQEFNILRNQYGYKTKCIISAKVLESMRGRFIELTKVHRQDDIRFIEMLADIRVGENVEQVVSELNDKCYCDHRKPITPIILTPTNSRADYYNQSKLSALPGEMRTYNGIIEGQFIDADNLPAPMCLQVKIGSRVILIKNNPTKGWVNGSLATVTRTERGRVFVRLDGQSDEREVCREKWEKFQYIWSENENKIVPEVIGSYSQLPIKAAWAITIHKAQGLTLEDARIDMSNGAFAAGLAYVALSRVRSLAGLSLAQRLSPADIKIDPDMLELTQGISRKATPWTYI